MAIVPEQSEKVVPQVLVLAEEHALVCFDPQAGKVYLPPHLAAKERDTAPAETSSAQSEPERSEPPAALGQAVPETS